MVKPVVVRKWLIVSQSLLSLRKALLVSLHGPFQGKDGFKENCSVSSTNKGVLLRHALLRNMPFSSEVHHKATKDSLDAKRQKTCK